MDTTQSPTQNISEVINQNDSGVIVLQANPTVDAIGAATGLYLGLAKMGKSIAIACSNPPQSNLAGADKIQSSLVAGGDNLVISFPYTEGSIDKVDYNIQGNFFNLVIVPRPGYPKLDPDKVNYTYTGGKIDYVITIDAPNLNSLGQIYTENQNQFQGKNIINIDRHLINNSYGTVNFINKTSSSTSELVFQLLRDMRIEVDKEIATNLYSGLLAATNNFTSYSVNPGTFESASELMRLGAQKKQTGAGGGGGAPGGGFPPQGGSPFPGPSPALGGGVGGFPPQQPPGGFGGGFPQQRQQPFGGMNGQAQNPVGGDFMGGGSSFPKPPQRPPQQGGFAPPPYQNQQNEKPIEYVEQQPDGNRETGKPQDWLKPKIFGGKNNKKS
jgi:hypothetical protein